MFTCIFIAGTLFMVDATDSIPVGPNSYVQLYTDSIQVTVGNSSTYYNITPELYALGITGIMQLCEEIAFDALPEPEMEDEPSAFVPSNEKEI